MPSTYSPRALFLSLSLSLLAASVQAATYEGCYSSSDPLTSIGTWRYQSTGYCGGQCAGSAVYAMSEGDACWCGDQLPALDDKVDMSDCDTDCVGFPADRCGGNGVWSVYAVDSDATNFGGGGSSSSSSRPSGSPSRTTQAVVTSTNAGKTIVVTVPATAAASTTADSNSDGGGGGGGGGNTVGIAVGVVVGVVAFAALIGGVYFYLRRRRRIAAEEDFKQRTQVSDFMRGGDERKPPATGYSGTSDARLDPEAGRRDSVGSLADNQDYSRRILRVANPSE